MKKKKKKLSLEDILPKYTVDDFVSEEEYERQMERATEDIDNHLDRLKKYIGRDLTKLEQTGVIEVVEEFSTKDEQGYITLYFSFVQAWKIYQKKREKSEKRRKRR
jgi:hypothetical protein